MNERLANLIDMSDRRAKKKHKVDITEKLPPGHSWNPLLSIPKEMNCPCDSGDSYGECCFRKMPPVIPSDLAAEYLAQMRDVPYEAIRFEGDPINGDKKSNS